MKKEIKYPLNGLALGAITGIIYSLLEQYFDLKEKGLPFFENINAQRLMKHSAIGGGLGAVVGYGYYKWDFHNESKKPFESNQYARSVLREHGGQNDSTSLRGRKIRDDIKGFICDTYNGKLVAKPINWGSTARGTAINSNCDYDILVPFSKRSFKTLKEMYNSLYSSLNDNYGNANVRKQGRSIGVTFNIGEENIHFDIVPGREINNFPIDKEVNLFVKGSLFKDSSRIKTNVDVPKEITVNRPKEREVVKLIKVYRDRYGFKVNSTFLQHLVMEAFDKVPPSHSTSNNLLYTMDYLADKLPYARIVDPGNSNNVISKNTNEYSRNNMANQLISDLNKLDKNGSYIREIFPL